MLGTDGDDLFRLVEGADYGYDRDEEHSVTISAGDGDDDVNFDPDTSATGSPVFGAIDGGAGDDTISVRSEAVTITGGGGDDVVSFRGQGSTIYGGDGNDAVNVEGIFVQVEGGAGDDVLDGRDANSVNLFGGAGEDTLLLSGYTWDGTGYVLSADGGDGDDTLIYDGSPRPSFDALSTATMTGGAGLDRFEVSFDESLTDDRALSDSYPDVWDVVALADFTSGEDLIIIQPEQADPSFSIASARLEEDTSAGETRVIVTYESAGEDDRELAVVINATGLTWDDITFVGDHIPPVLEV